MRKLLLPCVLLAALLASCEERKTKSQAEKLLSEAIEIPTDIGRVVFGRDTMLVDAGESPARLVIYTDSLSCSSCRLKYMFEYNDILGLHEELGSDFIPIFVFSPRKGQATEIRNTLLLYRFDYPIFLDDKGLFPAANPHIPADNRFHTFLLDKNGKVVLVGDPVNNPALWELYKTTITRLIENGGTMPAVEKTGRIPDHDLRTNDSPLRFDATIADLGRMKIGQRREIVFSFTNVGPTPVVITRISTSCGCTSVEYEKTPLMPGEASEIGVEFEPEEKGAFFKKIFVYCAGESRPLEIAVKGEVK